MVGSVGVPKSSSETRVSVSEGNPRRVGALGVGPSPWAGAMFHTLSPWDGCAGYEWPQACHTGVPRNHTTRPLVLRGGMVSWFHRGGQRGDLLEEGLTSLPPSHPVYATRTWWE